MFASDGCLIAGMSRHIGCSVSKRFAASLPVNREGYSVPQEGAISLAYFGRADDAQARDLPHSCTLPCSKGSCEHSGLHRNYIAPDFPRTLTASFTHYDLEVGVGLARRPL
jgi:hypothetical protein